MRILHTRFLLPFTFTVSTWFDISASANADVDAAIISNQRDLVQNVLDDDNDDFAHTLNYISRYDDDDNIPERNTWDMWDEDYYDQVSVEQALERTSDGDINHDAASSFSCKIKSDGRFGSVGGDDYFDVTYALQMTYHGGYWLAELFHHLNLKLGEKVVATLFPPCADEYDDDNDRRGRELSENLYSNTKLHQWELTHIAYSIAGMDVEMDYNEEGNCIDYVSHNEQYMCGVFTSSIRVFLVDDDDDRRNRKRRSMTATSDMVENVINVVVQDSISDVASNVKGIGELVNVDLEEYRAIKNKDDGVEDEDEDEDVAEKYENEIMDGHKHDHEHEETGEHNHEHEEEGQEHEGHYEEGKTHDQEHDHDDETDHDHDHDDEIKKTIAKSQEGPVDSKKSERLHAVGWTMIGLSVVVICAIGFRKYKNRNQYKKQNGRSMQKRDLIMCESHPGTISDHSKHISGHSCDLEGNVLLDAVRDEERRGTPDDRVEIIFDEGSVHSNCNEWHH